MVLEHQHTPYRTSSNLTREQLSYDTKVVAACRLHLKQLGPPTPFEITNDLVVTALDNLDMYDKKAHTRIKNGECVTRHMLHAVVGTHMFFPKSIPTGLAPVGDMLIRETEQVVKHAALPSKAAVRVSSGPSIWPKLQL